MSIIKRVAAVTAAACLAVLMSSGIVACGEAPAATWAHGEISEEEVTTAIENMRTSYGMTDDESWGNFVKQRYYDIQAVGQEGEGTVAEMREYVIEQMVRQDIVEWKIEDAGIEVSDEEVEAYVEQQRQAVESQYMPGVFESVLQRQGYEDLDAFKEQAKQTLAQQKLQEMVENGEITADGTADAAAAGDAAATDDAAAEGEATDAEATDDAAAEDAASEDADADGVSDKWEAYVDALYEQMNVVISDMPAGLSYDLTANAEGDDAAADDAAAEGDAAADDASATDDDAEGDTNQ